MNLTKVTKPQHTASRTPRYSATPRNAPRSPNLPLVVFGSTFARVIIERLGPHEINGRVAFIIGRRVYHSRRAKVDLSSCRNEIDS
jgi:hypothetical protein